MASGGKRGGAGERVLESRHVIGLFMLMLLFSGVFFTLGFVMGRNQYDGQVRAETEPRAKLQIPFFSHPGPCRKASRQSATLRSTPRHYCTAEFGLGVLSRRRQQEDRRQLEARRSGLRPGAT